MAKTVIQQFDNALDLLIKKKLTSVDTAVLKKDLSDLMRTMNVERLKKGKDTDGNGLSDYSKKYKIFKGLYIGGKRRIKGRTKKEYAAKKVYDYGMLSGRTLGQIKYEVLIKQVGDRIRLSFRTFANASEANNMIKWLSRQGFDFYGGLALPSSGQGKRELNKVKNFIIKWLKK